MEIKIKKLSENAVLPSKTFPTDAGFDLTAIDSELDIYGNIVYHTGLSFEIPEGYAGFLFPRSSNAKKDMMLTNSVGVIDSHYRGEVTMKFKHADRFVEKGKWIDEKLMDIYQSGDRIGQLIIMPIPEIEFKEVNELSKTDRGDGSYGSTGK